MESKSKLKTIKEWNESIGGLLVNYDGFLPIYEKLTGDIAKTNIDYIYQRLSGAGEILCTREAFISGINHCTIYGKGNSEETEQVIPEYEEGGTISLLLYECEDITEDYLYNNNDSKPENIENIKGMIEKIMKYRKISRETYCKEDNSNFQKCLEEMEKVQEDEYVQFWLEGQKLPSEHFKDLIGEGAISTVEELEENLVGEILDKINNLDLKKGISKEELSPILPKLYILSQAVIPCSERHQRIFGNQKCYKNKTAISEHYDEFSLSTPLSRKEEVTEKLDSEEIKKQQLIAKIREQQKTVKEQEEKMTELSELEVKNKNGEVVGYE